MSPGSGDATPTGRRTPLPRKNLHLPSPPAMGGPARLAIAAANLALAPLGAVGGWLGGAPGLRWRKHALWLVARALTQRPRAVTWPVLYRLSVFPLDSTRHFEFEFFEQRVAGETFERALDLSSPRLLPISLLQQRRVRRADLVNPDPADLAVTQALVRAAALDERCATHGCDVLGAPFPDAAFDLITTMSVLEHIPADRAAVERMWALLRPGGRLLLTVPCAAQASEQYIDHNEYGLLDPGPDGFVFWQRFYDEERLQASVFEVTGPPVRRAVYGERRPGTFAANAARKRADPAYPLWREPMDVARSYARFRAIADLPGEGVVGLEFRK